MEQPLSLFSFQDIVTSVTGVMILLTLLLAVELIQRIVSSAPQQTMVQITASTKSIEELRAEIALLQSRLDASGEMTDELPSFDRDTLRRTRIELEQSNERLEREIASLNDRLQDKRRQVSAAEAASVNEQKQGTEELARLEQTTAAVKEQLDSINSSNRVFFRKEKGGKETWIVELAVTRIQSAKIGVVAKPLEFNGIAPFERWLKAMSPASTALYIIVKPGSEELFEEAKEAVRRNGYDVGYHVMPADQQVIDPTSGAGAP
jgi:hypothetical protein